MRASISIAVVVVALAGTLDIAAAQYYPPPAYPSSQPYTSAPLPPPGAPVPPGAVGNDAEDATYQPPPYGPPPYGQPAYGPPPYGQPGYGPPPYGAPRGPYPHQADDYPPMGPPPPGVTPEGRLPPQPMPTLGEGPFERPPGNIDGGDQASAGPDVTGSVRTPAAAPPYAAPPNPRAGVAGLPPDYQPEQGPPKDLPPQFQRQLVDYMTKEPAGTIIVDTPHTYLYLVLGHGKALRYGIGVGREGFTWTGTERISRVKEWPDWFPPREMIERQPYLPRFMAGGEENPLGARALYLGHTLYRIHGTNQPSTIGTFVSSGCIRLTNADIEDLYGRVGVGTRVVVMPGAQPATASAQTPPVVQ